MKKRFLFKFFALLLCMLMGVVHGAKANRCFTQYWGVNTENIHHPTPTEPYLAFNVLFYDENSGDSFFLNANGNWNNGGDGEHRGVAIYVDGNYICSDNYFLPYGSWNYGSDKGNDGKDGKVEEICASVNGWWTSGENSNGKWNVNGYAATVNGTRYRVKFWDPFRTGDLRFVRVNVWMDKISCSTSHTVTIKGWWRNRDKGATNAELMERTWKFNGISDLSQSVPPATKMTAWDKFDLVTGPLWTQDGSKSWDGSVGTLSLPDTYITEKDMKNAYGSIYVKPDDLANNNSYKAGASETTTFSCAYTPSNHYNTTWLPVEFHRTTKSPDNEDNVTIYQFRHVKIAGFVKPQNLKISAEMWKKKTTLVWEVNNGDENSNSTNGTWSVYRYLDDNSEDKVRIAKDIDYSICKYTDTEVPEYDKKYRYEVTFVPKNAPALEQPQELTTSDTITVARNFPITIEDVVKNEGKKNFTIKWKTNAFLGNESYNFAIYRASNGTWGNDPIATIQVTNKNQQNFSYTDASEFSASSTYQYKVRLSMLENKLFESNVSKMVFLGDNSEVSSLSTTKGEYSGLVKISWTAKQVGTTATKYIVERRLKGSEDWAVIYRTSGTSDQYYFEDNTALPGQFYDYRVTSSAEGIGADDNGEVVKTTIDNTKTDDGFCRATGVISGRISYGTGVAVPNATVRLKQNNDSEDNLRQFYALRTANSQDGISLDLTESDLKKRFGEKPFSVQMYVSPDADQLENAHPVLFDLAGTLQLRLGTWDAVTNKYSLILKNGETEMTMDAALAASNYTSLTLTKDETGTAVMTTVDKDGNVQTKDLGKLSFSWNTEQAQGLRFGGSYTSDAANIFTGYIDELRIFSGKALSTTEIKSNYNHTLAGTESGLFLYWPIDEGFAGQSTAYDYSKTSGVANGHHGCLSGQTTSTVIPTEEQLSLFAVTDEQGNFVLRGVPFSGDGTNYTIIPTMGIHEFSPSYSTRYVSASSLTHSAVDFSDVSSFPVTGVVYYDGTDYPVEGCNFYVDGTICSKDGEAVTTDEEGKFTLSVPIGEHFIQVKKDGHEFISNGRYPEDPNGVGTKMTFDKSISNLEFLDATLVNFTGRVVGGSIEGDKPLGFGQSTNNIGMAEIILQAQDTKRRLNVVKVKNETSYSYETNTDNVTCASATSKISSKSWRGAKEDDADYSKSIFILTDEQTGEFSALLPPLIYTVQSVKVKSTNQDVGSSVTLDLSNALRENTDTLYAENGVDYELYTYNTALRQTYHSTPSFAVKQKGAEAGAFGIDNYHVEDMDGEADVKIYTASETDGVKYTYGYPVFVSGDNYTFEFEGFEEYVNQDDKDNVVTSRVPLAGNIVTISNAMSADQKVCAKDMSTYKYGDLLELEENQLQLDDDGKATYKWKAGLPNITEPYTRTLSINYDIEGRSYAWNKGLEGIVLGSLPTGNNFVTAGPDIVDMILRDPPGTNSFAAWTTGSVTTTSKLKGRAWSSENTAMTTTHLGVKIETLTGSPFFQVASDFETLDDLGVGITATTEGESSDTWVRTVTNTKTISTSSAPEFVGPIGDVFIGTATNILYGAVRNVGIRRADNNEFELNLKDMISTSLDFKTAFNYTANYIENVLLPNLESVRNSFLTKVNEIGSPTNNTESPVYLTTLSEEDERFGSSNSDKEVWGEQAVASNKVSENENLFVGPSYTIVWPKDNTKCYSDTIAWYNLQIANWKKALATNEEQKVMAIKDTQASVQNYSFDAGSSVTVTTAVDTTSTHTYDITVMGLAKLSNAFGLRVNTTGVDCTLETTTGGGTHNINETSESHSAEISYTLAEEGDDDAISVDVFDGKRKSGTPIFSHGPVFYTRGGQTSNPYEGEVKTKYYSPGTTIMEATMQIEVPKIRVNNNRTASLSNVPTGTPANFTLQLTNESQIDEDVYYKLLLIDESNNKGAKVSIDGMPLTDGRLIKIPAGTEVTKALQISQTDQGVLDYEDIGIVLASQTQFDPTSTWDVIADTVFVSVHYVPSSTDVKMNLGQAVMNTTNMPNVKKELNLTFNNFDRNYKNLKAFRVQYKALGATDWTTYREYVLADDGHLSSYQEVLPDDANVTCPINVASLPDGDYVFRVLSVCSYGNDEVYKSSNEIAITKDMEKPRPLGQPTPTNGILTAADDISITFNEDIVKGELTETANFRVTGVLNEQEVEHETALNMTDAEVTASTETDINLSGKSFSMDMWMNAKGKGTILSHGNASSKFSLGVTEDSKLAVTVANETYTSVNAIPQNKWVFLTLNYQAQNNGGLLSANVAEDANEIELFKNLDVVKYAGNGMLAVGKNMMGAIHELTLWDEAHDMTSALLNRSKTKVPSTRHLIGYWKMNEGEGTVITDYARNRHMKMTAESWYINNVNKAVALDGKNHLAMSIGHCSPLEDDSYAVELWMRADKQKGESQLLQAGRVGLWMDANGILQLSSGDKAGKTDDINTYTASKKSLQDNVWHHVALNVLRNGNAAVYVDGERTMATSASNIATPAADSLLIGTRRTLESENEYVYDRPLTAQIDEVRLWNAMLNADFLKNHRKLRLTGTEPGLVAYYPFEKKTLDAGNQIVTVGNAADLTDTSDDKRMAVCGEEMVYVDEAPALRTKPAEENVPFDFVASDNKIVINVRDDYASRIEGCTLNFTVQDVKDMNGNLSDAVCWSAYVNQNQLEWKNTSVKASKNANEEATFTATIVNKGGKQQMWTLDGMPSWLKADIDNGTSDALAETDILFTIAKSTPVGKYEETVYLVGSDGMESALTIHVTVNGENPSWSVDATKYENSMNIISTLTILGVPSTDADDVVAVFIDDECRGVAQPKYNSRYDEYFVMFNVYGDAQDAGKTLTFKAYDASTGITYPALQTSEPGVWKSNGLIGKLNNPLRLEAVDVLEQSQTLNSGWNWMSFYVAPDDMEVGNMFSSVADGVSIVKAQNGFAKTDDSLWYGSLHAIDNKSLYMVQMNEAKPFHLLGKRLDKAQKQITVEGGWNWIAYNGTSLISVADAFAGMQPVDGDLLKSQSSFAVYDGYEWIGSLETLAPGQGYMLQRATDETSTFTYPEVTTSTYMAKRFMTRSTPSVFTPIPRGKYPYNMTIVAQVKLNGEPVDVGTEVGVFAGEECRTAEFTTTYKDYTGIAYLTIPGDETAKLTFKMPYGDEILTSDVTLDYKTDDMLGTIRNPFVISFEMATGIHEVEADADEAEAWYDLNGRCLKQRPTMEGVYIRRYMDKETRKVKTEKVIIKNNK